MTYVCPGSRGRKLIDAQLERRSRRRPAATTAKRRVATAKRRVATPTTSALTTIATTKSTTYTLTAWAKIHQVLLSNFYLPTCCMI